MIYTEDGEEMDEEDLPDEDDNDNEMEEIDTMFMGTESEARRRFQIIVLTNQDLSKIKASFSRFKI